MKLTSNTILFILILTLLWSCKDESAEQVAPAKNLIGDANVSISDNIVRFSSLDYYREFIENADEEAKQSFIKKLDDNKNYMSLRKVFLSKSKTNANGRSLTSEEEDVADSNDFLSSMLNEDGLIGIGDYLFKVNLETERVYAMPASTPDMIEDLKNENPDNKSILVFSTDDDVIDLLEEGVKGTLNGKMQLFCGQSGASARDAKGFDYISTDYRQDNKVVYQKAGVYFSLQAKTKTQYKGWTGIWNETDACDQRIDYYVWFDPKCKSSTGYSGTKYDNSCSSNELNYRPYESTRGLHHYEYDVYFYGLGLKSKNYRIED